MRKTIHCAETRLLTARLGGRNRCVACPAARVLLIGWLVLLLAGCGGVGLLKRGPSDQELVTQVMQQWVTGWANLDAELLSSLVSESYYGANGESKEELRETMEELRKIDCNLLTIGQYLQPSERHHPIVRFVPPEEFTEYERIGKEMGFSDVASSPLVRSSYKAAELYEKARMKGN